MRALDSFVAGMRTSRGIVKGDCAEVAAAAEIDRETYGGRRSEGGRCAAVMNVTTTNVCMYVILAETIIPSASGAHVLRYFTLVLRTSSQIGFPLLLPICLRQQLKSDILRGTALSDHDVSNMLNSLSGSLTWQFGGKIVQ